MVQRRARPDRSQKAQGMKWFNYSEFDSPDDPGSGNYMDEEFLDMLDEARSVAGIPFVITSGLRTEAWNHRVGGTPNSSHMKGCAADIACSTSRDRFLIVTALLEVGFDRIGIYDTYIHVDNDWEKNSALIFLH
jgi:zinc D-Ala-D-Ala carboxypeptidase